MTLPLADHSKQAEDIVFEWLREHASLAVQMQHNSINGAGWLKARITTALANAVRDLLDSQQFREGRLIEWLDTPPSERKPANIAFTAGHERQVAYRFESTAAKGEWLDGCEFCDVPISEREGTFNVCGRCYNKAVEQLMATAASAEQDGAAKERERIEDLISWKPGSLADGDYIINAEAKGWNTAMQWLLNVLDADPKNSG